MIQELKTFIIKFSIVVGGMLFLGSFVYGLRSYNEYAKEERHKQNQQSIRSMVEFCDFNKLSDTEQKQLRECGDDVEAVRSQLKEIIADRVVFWKSRIEEISTGIDKVNGIKSGSMYWSPSDEGVYQKVISKLKEDGRSAIRQYELWDKKKKELETWNPKKGDKKNLILEGEDRQRKGPTV